MNKPAKKSYYSLQQIFRSPFVLLVLTTIGLVAALVGDGWADVSSWIALATPIVTIVWMLYVAKRQLRAADND